MYGTWEVDRHGQGGVPGAPHDPATYVNFAKVRRVRGPDRPDDLDRRQQRQRRHRRRLDRAGAARGTGDRLRPRLHQRPPVHASPRAGERHLPAPPDGLQHDRPRATDPKHYVPPAIGACCRARWAAAAANVELLATEYNSVYSNPGKQMTSLVNGLFTADSIGGLLQTEYNAPTSGTCVTASTPATTIPPPSMAGGRAATTACSAPAPAPCPPPAPTSCTRRTSPTSSPPGWSSAATRWCACGPTTPTSPLRRAPVGRRPAPAGDQQAPDGGPGAAGDGQRVPARRLARCGSTARRRTPPRAARPTVASLTTSTPSLSLNGTGFSYTFPSYSMTVIELSPAPAVVGRHVFYNNSAFDGRDPAANAADDAAIATDKRSLPPGQSAAFENLTSYSRGINGSCSTWRTSSRDPVASDFVFETAAGPDATTWTPAPAPSSMARPPRCGRRRFRPGHAGLARRRSPQRVAACDIHAGSWACPRRTA